MSEFLAPGLHLFRGTGHNGDMVGSAAILCILFPILILQNSAKHLHGTLAGGNVLQIGRIFLFQIFDPGRAAAGKHGEGAALFQPLKELGGLFKHRQVCAEVGVVYFVRTHHFQSGNQIVQSVCPRFHAELLAYGNAHGGSDLKYDPCIRIIQTFPCLPDLIPDGDGAGGAGGRTLPAADAVRICQLLVECGHDLQLASAVCKVQNTHPLHFLAGANAVAAEDTFIGVADNGGRGGILFINWPRIRKTNLPHAELQSQLL